MSLKFAYKNRDYLTHLRMYFFYNYPLPVTKQKRKLQVGLFIKIPNCFRVWKLA